MDESHESSEDIAVIESFVFSEGRLVSHNLELEALRLARADKGLILWIDLTAPTPEETKGVLESLFEFHPLAIEDCLTLSELPKIEDYEDYLYMIMHSVGLTAEKTLKISELNLFLGKEFLVTYHLEKIPGISLLQDRLIKGTAPQARGADHLFGEHAAGAGLPDLSSMAEQAVKASANISSTQQVREIIGSGPFVFLRDEWVPGERAFFRRNERYVARDEAADGLAGGKLAKVLALAS
ncbi:MAG: hypothetical protein EBY81_08680, partial [Verrucomicrobia bacterium]|nr:hypothetical protein [Verrucomicrobiota bacterium]